MACHPRRSWLGPEPDRRNLQDRPRRSSQIEATPTTSDHDPSLVRHLTSRPNRVLSASKKARESSMEMHSRQSLNEIHGISAPPRRQPRWRSLMRRGIAGVRAVLKGIKEAIDAELAARRAIAELLTMDDRTLRDLGITRGEIGNLIRRPRGNVRAVDGLLSSDAGSHRPALPTISSPDLSPEGRPAAIGRDTESLISTDRRVRAR